MVPGVFYAARGKTSEHTGPEARTRSARVHVRDTRHRPSPEDGSSRKCILRDVQFDPVSDRPVHFDLQGLREDEKLTIEVPVVLTGGIPLGVP